MLCTRETEMKDISINKSKIEADSPKTPGGISKSLLTPCRRLGLSRNWRKSGPSPFISPLSNSSNLSTEVKETKKETKKRKLHITDEIPPSPEKTVCLQIKCAEESVSAADVKSDKNDLLETPEIISVPQKRKSKVIPSPKSNDEIIGIYEVHPKMKGNNTVSLSKNDVNDLENVISIPDCVSTPVTTKIKKMKVQKYSAPLKHNIENIQKDYTQVENRTNEDTLIADLKEKSPSDLTRKCVVIIQKNIFKNDVTKTLVQEKKEKTKHELIKEDMKFQTLFDSDSDEVPLIQLNKKNNDDKVDKKIIIIDDDDFVDKEDIKRKKLEEKHLNIESPVPKNSVKINQNTKPIKMELVTQQLEDKPSSQSSNSFDDDDEDFEQKKTILIRKTYDKVTKPSKAKSTGSITQKNIDELQSRIDIKKKLLIAKAMTPETEELRELIKKWQKGCQDALIELMKLMVKKFPEKNFDYAEMLQMLKIPPDLVGFDSDNDCFNSPDDRNIILSSFKL